jgi:hypothetical protein
MKHPQYTITTPIGEECVHLNFFTNLKIKSEATIGEVTFINLNDDSTFWIKESQWISIQREIKLNKLIK